MGKECKTEVERVMNEKAKDYRLNYRLSHACEQDIPRLCSSVCSSAPGQACGGMVLQCLQVGVRVRVRVRVERGHLGRVHAGGCGRSAVRSSSACSSGAPVPAGARAHEGRGHGGACVGVKEVAGLCPALCVAPRGA